MNANMVHSYNLSLKMKILHNLGYDLGNESVIMDFGCGSGEMVQELRENNYQAFGCDIKFKMNEKVKTKELIDKRILRNISLLPYNLPFEDNTFDFVYSHSVFEHVFNYAETISEISRVLKPDGMCIHFFSSRFRPIESHVFVPFASVIKSFWWLYLWTLLGVRNEWENCENPKVRALRFQAYLKGQTNYLTKTDLKKQFGNYFRDVEFLEKEFLNCSRWAKYIFPLLIIFPFLPSMYSTFRSRVVKTSKPIKR